MLAARRTTAAPGSYTKRLYEDPKLLRAKLLEEAQVRDIARPFAAVALPFYAALCSVVERCPPALTIPQPLVSLYSAASLATERP